jgi:hypothetical protein
MAFWRLTSLYFTTYRKSIVISNLPTYTTCAPGRVSYVNKKDIDVP